MSLKICVLLVLYFSFLAKLTITDSKTSHKGEGELALFLDISCAPWGSILCPLSFIHSPTQSLDCCAGEQTEFTFCLQDNKNLCK